MCELEGTASGAQASHDWPMALAGLPLGASLSPLLVWASGTPQKALAGVVAQAQGGLDKGDALKQGGLWVSPIIARHLPHTGPHTPVRAVCAVTPRAVRPAAAVTVREGKLRLSVLRAQRPIDCHSVKPGPGFHSPWAHLGARLLRLVVNPQGRWQAVRQGRRATAQGPVGRGHCWVTEEHRTVTPTCV